jgi:hypothetical protein
MTLRALLGLTGLALIGTLAAACTAPSTNDNVDTLGDALTAADFDTTVQQLTALPWLPWAYTTDGCYARAEYYSMLLTTKGVPSNHIYVVAQAGTALGGIWSWHVAPLVTKDGDPNHLYVLDPVYDQTKAMTNVEWVAHQDWPDPSVEDYPSLHVQPGNSYLAQYEDNHQLISPAEPNASEYKEPKFADMPAFGMPNINHACATMHRYIDYEPGTSAAQKAEKHTALGRETKRLVGDLATKGKISGDPTALRRTCTRDPGFENDNENENILSDPLGDPSRQPRPQL